MTKKETISLFGILIAAYPNFDKFKDDSQVEGNNLSMVPPDIFGGKYGRI